MPTTSTMADLWAEYHRGYRALGHLLQWYTESEQSPALPLIRWSVETDSTGCCLLGVVPQAVIYSRAWEPRDAFEAWRGALGIPTFQVHYNPDFRQTTLSAHVDEWHPEIVGSDISLRLTLELDYSETADSLLVYSHPG